MEHERRLVIKENMKGGMWFRLDFRNGKALSILLVVWEKVYDQYRRESLISVMYAHAMSVLCMATNTVRRS